MLKSVLAFTLRYGCGLSLAGTTQGWAEASAFVATSGEASADTLGSWPHFPLWSVALAVLGAAIFTYGLMCLSLRRRTAALREAESWWQENLNQAPLPITQVDYSAVRTELCALREGGVHDLAAWLVEHPDEMRRLNTLMRVTGANQLALKLAGVQTVDELNRIRLSIQSPNATEAFRPELFALWDGRPNLMLEKSYLLGDGRRHEALVHWSAIVRNGEPDYSRVQCAYTDVTDIRTTQRALQQSERRYRDLFEATPNPMYIFDAETLCFVAVNEVAVQRYGYSREEFAQMTVLELRPPDEVPRLRQSLAQHPQHDPSLDTLVHNMGIWRHRCRDGTILWVEVYTHTLILGGRTCVLVLPFDITAKLATERALRDSETRYRELFEHAINGIYRCSPEGLLISANPALARMLGFSSPAELLIQHAKMPNRSFYVRASRGEEFRALLSDGRIVSDFESEVRTADGASIWVSETARAVCNDDGRMLYYEGFVTDVSVRRRLEAELMRNSKLEAVGILAGGIAHDFNNILTAVLGNISLAEADTDVSLSTHSILREARQAALRARDLTQQLLTFAKGGEPVRATVALPELLRETVTFAMHGSKAKAEISLESDLRPINADKGQISQVVQNLVINAAQAMPGGGHIRISAGNAALAPGLVAALADGGDFVKITVSDNGPGIQPEHLSSIFDPYFTTKEHGSGLGLATVYSIVRRHKGHIEVESQLGQGSHFHVWLPAAQVIAEDNPPARVNLSEIRARILFMDDEKSIREMARLFFDRLGAQSQFAADGTEAVRAHTEAHAAGQPFDIIIMDLTVPGGMGGKEAMARIRTVDTDTWSIVSSGYSCDPVMADHQAHGFCDVLPKPYTFDQLRRALQSALQRQKS